MDDLRNDATHARTLLDSAMESVFEAANAELAAWRRALVARLEGVAGVARLPTGREAIEEYLRDLPPTRVWEFRRGIGSAYLAHKVLKDITLDCVAAATVLEAGHGGTSDPARIAMQAMDLLLDLRPGSAAGDPPFILSADFKEALAAAREPRRASDVADEAFQSASKQAELKRQVKEKRGGE